MAARPSSGVDRTLLTVGALLLAALLGWQNGLGRSDWLLYDAFVVATPHRPHPDIVIVAIDDRSLTEVGRWPWRRDRHTDLIERISAQAPRAIGLDLLLSEPEASEPRLDIELTAAVKRSGVVVLPVFMASLSSHGYDAVPPIAPLAEAARDLGHVSVELDSDGIARSVFLREGTRGQWFDHFTVALLRAAGYADRVRQLPGRHENGSPADPMPDDGFWHRDDWVQIAFAGPPGTYPTVSAADVLRGDVPDDAFRGKIVLLGPTAVGLGDVYPTPLSGQSIPMAGVEISANILDNLLTGAGSVRALPWQSAVFSLLMVALLLPGLWLFSPRKALVLTAALMLSTVALSYLGLRLAGLWLPPGAVLAMMLLVYPLWVWRRLEAAVTYLGAELVRLRQQDPVLPRVEIRMHGDLIDRRMGALQQAADHLRALHLFISSTIESLPDVTLVTDDAGTVMLCNHAAALYFGESSAAALRGASLPVLLRDLRPIQSPGLSGGMHVTQVDTGLHGIECRDGRDGEYLFKRTASAGLQDQPGVWIVCLVDLYALRQAERKRDEALRFLSHDMRGPQASIQTLLDLHHSDPGSLSQDELLARIRRHSGRTLALAEAFVQIARAESMPFRREPIDYSDIVLDAADACWEQAQARRIRIDTALVPDPASGSGSRDMLTRALVNLLTNAIKYSDPGSVVECAVKPAEDQWCLSVRDRGRGIAPEDQVRVFQRFARFGPQDGKDAEPGIGLGLAFTKAVVERHGGRIEFDSEPGVGTEFRIYLRADDDPDHSEA